MGILFGLLIGLLMGAGTFITFAAEDPPAPVTVQIPPSPSPSPSLTPTPLPTVTPTPDPTPTPSVTPTRTPTPMKKPVITLAIIPSPTVTPTPFSSPKPTATAAPTVSYSKSTPFDALFSEFANKYGVDVNLLKKIADCESHFNPGVVSPNGLYAGMFQFAAGTWDKHRKAMGADPNPDLRFGARESIETAAYVISRWGAGSWPACSS